MKIGVSLEGFDPDGILTIILENNGYEVWNPKTKTKDSKQISKLFRDCDVIISGTEPLSYLVEDSTRLKLILRAGIGIDNIPTDVCELKQIKWFICELPIVESVSNYVLGQILNISSGVYQNFLCEQNSWRNSMGLGIQETSVGGIGFGRIGKSVVKKISNFGFQGIGVHDSIYDYNSAELTELNFKPIDFKNCLSNYDIITLHTPLNSSTRNLISFEELKLMKNSAWIINTSRGGVVDEDALFDALISNSIEGAVLDVFSAEPYTGKLLNLPNVILTPHIATFNLSTRRTVERQLIDKAVEFIDS